jgi:hypothetical protein
MKIEWYWHQKRYEDQWNRIVDQDTDPCSYSHLIFNKGAQIIHWRKRQPLQQMVLGKLDIHL